jgi:hypothetical protein
MSKTGLRLMRGRRSMEQHQIGRLPGLSLWRWLLRPVPQELLPASSVVVAKIVSGVFGFPARLSRSPIYDCKLFGGIQKRTAVSHYQENVQADHHSIGATVASDYCRPCTWPGPREAGSSHRAMSYIVGTISADRSIN